MNKEITIYELLGLIKDGQAPKKIKFSEETFVLKDGRYKEIHNTNQDNAMLGDYFRLDGMLNDKVEIIEEDNKIKKIQTIGSKWYSEYIEGYFDGEEKYSAYDEYLMNKINELIDEINKLKEKRRK